MKILFLNEHRHNQIGGIETYTRVLAKYFYSNGHNVSEAVFFEDKIEDKTNKLDFIKEVFIFKNKKINPIKRINIINKILPKIINDFDLIICQISMFKWPKYFYKNEKVLYVQHFCPDFFEHKFFTGKFFSIITSKLAEITGFKNSLKNFKNIIVFSESDKERIKLKNWQKAFCIPLAKYSKIEIKSMMNEEKENSKDFIFLGRIENRQKNVSFIQKIFKKANLEINFYGNDDKKIIQETNKIKYKGSIKQEDLPLILNKYKFLVLLSKYEGFPFVLVEALSHGIPFITTNCFVAAKTLTKNNGFLVKNKEKEIIETLNNMKSLDNNQLKTLQQNCFNYALENLSLEVFYNKWNDVINYFETKNKN
ncbi:MAG: glycosyltransferase family 4 protein [Metamycoplasmataceae bacterium]